MSEVELKFRVDPEDVEKLLTQLSELRKLSAKGKKLKYTGFFYADSYFCIRFKVVEG